MVSSESEIDIVGLGVMGRNLLLNVVDHGYSAAGYDREAAKVEALRAASTGGDVFGAESVEDFVQHLRKPRAVVLLVPAGHAVDAAIEALLPLLEPGDVVVDGGNSHFRPGVFHTQWDSVGETPQTTQARTLRKECNRETALDPCRLVRQVNKFCERGRGS